MSHKGYGWSTAGLKQPPFPRGGWCPTCGAPFASDTAFDTHRVGQGEARTCLPVDEFADVGLRLLDSGVWAGRPRGDAARPTHWGKSAR